MIGRQPHAARWPAAQNARQRPSNARDSTIKARITGTQATIALTIAYRSIATRMDAILFAAQETLQANHRQEDSVSDKVGTRSVGSWLLTKLVYRSEEPTRITRESGVDCQAAGQRST